MSTSSAHAGDTSALSTTPSSSYSQHYPARSFFHRSYRASVGPFDNPQHSSQDVREQTAGLASFALCDASSSIHSTSPRQHSSILSEPSTNRPLGYEDSTPRAIDAIVLPSPIREVPEPVSPEDGLLSDGKSSKSAGTSVLTGLLRSSPPTQPELAPNLPSTSGTSLLDDRDDEYNYDNIRDHRPSQYSNSFATEAGGEEPTEHSKLLPKMLVRHPTADGNDDLEGQRPRRRRTWSKIRQAATWPREHGIAAARIAFNPKCWDRKALWKQGVVQPVGYIPSVVLGLLLNILDALSYGMILFPLGHPIFANLGPDGISIFYVSCIVSQLVYSCGGSIFKGGIGSEMIEVVPFFHKMAFTILAHVGEGNPKSVVATTILAYSLSSILTGLVFFFMGACKLGSLIGFFPRHILIGCIGGVGWFLVATGLEVSARLDGNLEYNLPTLQKLLQFDTIFLWTVPLVLAIVLLIAQRWMKHPLFVPCYFLLIPAVFYFFVAVIPSLDLTDLRQSGWVFDMPAAGEPFYHFYSLFDFGAVNWEALSKTIPAMFALTFFGILHVPINIPALGFSTGEDHVDVDRELIAHGVSNALSGMIGSIQNYLVYTNSLLFIRSGGDSRVAGVMLALATFGVMAIGPTIIGYIPIMVVGALIFLLGIELMREALYDTWGKLHRFEYLTIVVIVVTMGAWDFVVGILAGIVLACLNFVVQSSQRTAIRATYSGESAGSTVRRHAIQRRYLKEVGKQTHVAKLGGYLFFGTIVNVENRIRALLEEEAFERRPIRFLVFDLYHVTGIDFSAAEAFTRINRILGAKNVDMIMCGLGRTGEIGLSLQGVGLWDDGNNVQVFEDLNSALEFCENEYLKAFYSRRDALSQKSAQVALDVPKTLKNSLSFDTTLSSPRGRYLHQVATSTLMTDSHNHTPTPKWQNFKQPLPLILQIFQDLTTKNEDFWYKAIPYFKRSEYAAGSIIFQKGDSPSGFYLLEDGILKAEYNKPQGTFYESIVAGTTCGELPFFSGTNRTATVSAERDCAVWVLNEERWGELQRKHQDVSAELLRISLKLTSERMEAITS
ncbi:MAG: hypothetical protein M1829_002610 [Trizodia sp. TS-e1964]|nr:MAG: hypothetical protein M1829_002610 [Trizodia sp. TS-e1964]